MELVRGDSILQIDFRWYQNYSKCSTHFQEILKICDNCIQQGRYFYPGYKFAFDDCLKMELIQFDYSFDSRDEYIHIKVKYFRIESLVSF